MRIAIVTPGFPSVSETFISNRAAYLSERGHHVTVFAVTINHEMFNRLFAGNNNITLVGIHRKAIVKYLLLHPAAFKTSGGNGSFKKQVFTNARAAMINQTNPDIIHFEFSGMAVEFLEEMDKMKAGKVVSCRGTGEKVKLFTDKKRRENLQKVFKKIDLIHCVSDDIRRTIMPVCDDVSKTFINYPSIDTVRFQRSKDYSKHNEFLFLTIGRFTFQKGYLTGLLAIKQLKQKGIKFKWLIVGNGPQEEEILFHINQMELHDCVELLGSKTREEIIELYHNVDLFFLPSVYEGIANVVLEAMSMELPVVCTMSGGMAEVITHEVDGMLAEVYDSNLLAAHIEKLTHDFEMRKAMGKAARVKVQEKFNINLQATIFEQQYQKLLNEANA